MTSMVRLRNFGLVLILMVIFILAYLAVEASHNPDSQAHNGYINDQKQNQETLGRPSSWSPVTLFTLGLVIVAAIQAGLFIEQLRFIRISSNDTAKAANAAKDSADAAIKQAEVARKTFSASLRPWIKAELVLGGPIVWTDQGGSIMLIIKMVNVGNVPALGVDAEIDARSPMGSDVPAEQIAFADQFRRKSNIGFTMFPNDPVSFEYTTHINQIEIARAKSYWCDKMGIDRDALFLTLFTCVTYWSTVDDTIRQTSLIYKVQRRPDANNSTTISPTRGDVPLEALCLKRWPQEGRTD